MCRIPKASKYKWAGKRSKEGVGGPSGRPDEISQICLHQSRIKSYARFRPQCSSAFCGSDTIEGMFSDPMHGGNAGLIGWQLIGYPGPLMNYRDEIDKNHGRPGAVNR
jgi:hypothetical protein